RNESISVSTVRRGSLRRWWKRSKCVDIPLPSLRPFTAHDLCCPFRPQALAAASLIEPDQHSAGPHPRPSRHHIRQRGGTMQSLLKEIRHHPLLWLLVAVPIVLVAEKAAPEAHTVLFVLAVLA